MLKMRSIRLVWLRDWRSTIYSNSVDVSPFSRHFALCADGCDGQSLLTSTRRTLDGKVCLLASFSKSCTDFAAESITLSKEDKLYKDAIETAATSGIVEVAEDLLSYFVYVLLFSLHLRD